MKRKLLEDNNPILSFFNENGYKDIWINNIIKKLSPLDVITLSFVCKRFKSDLKNMGELFVIFSLRCRDCGNLSFDHTCRNGSCWRFCHPYNIKNILVGRTKEGAHPFTLQKTSVKRIYRYLTMDTEDIVLTVYKDFWPRWGSGYTGTVDHLLIDSNLVTAHYYDPNRNGYETANRILYFEFHWKNDCPSDIELYKSACDHINGDIMGLNNPNKKQFVNIKDLLI